ncbi:hypothetical protein [Marinobacter sp. BGYM27]|uniref:hypothetical protein n=1 Tax=Marinobacter sp. BGYM27 TaxID=2975597 RepID=UPI0021A36717|nr:hypothetical protein [Marinobacter sp. BGYM27]MDG5499715.1 hypothetical protein [Marinobacter sp. BGYM27]
MRALSLIMLASLPAAGWSYTLVSPNPTVVPHDQPYFTSDIRNTELIYTEKNKPFAEHVAGLELYLQPVYEASFGFEMSEQLSVGLISDFNQIANGFSTQFPVNRQINYVGGALQVDYFTTTSWLDTLIYHETAHNYQINPRNNPVSSTLYEWFGVGSVITPLIPAITPNLFESSFILEGNAVLNESWHGNGGRLYNGRMTAMTLQQAEKGELTAGLLYNVPLRFPYGERPYVLGGHYQYFLAERFGLGTTNRYFFNRSAYWYWPFMVNTPTLDTFDFHFDTTIAKWSATMAKRAQGLVKAEGEPVGSSQYALPLSSDAEEIFFLTSPTGVRAPELVRIDKQTGDITRKRVEYPSGKLVKQNGSIYSVSGRPVSPWRIYQGLFDDDAVLVEGTEGRIVQGTLSDGRSVYFDVSSSYSEPQLYVGDTFYGEVNSSVLIGPDDALYYFRQDGRQRTLYRNRDPLFSIEGYYGLVEDVDSEGRVYFVANTDLGSGLFRFDGTGIEQVSPADNIAEARLINDETLLVKAVSADDYYYVYQPVQVVDGGPASTHLFWDASANDSKDDTATSSASNDVPAIESDTPQPAPPIDPVALDLDEPYNALLGLRYRGSDLSLFTLTRDNNNGEDDTTLGYSLFVEFADPLTQNSVSLFALRDEDWSQLAGLSYVNRQYFVLAGIKAYGVMAEDLDELLPPDESRGFGMSAELRLPFLEAGYWYGELGAFHYLDYRELEREPTGLQLNLSRITRFGHSLYPNSLFAAEGFAVEDRGDTTSGGSLELSTDFPYEFYAGVSGKYARSSADTVSQFERRGVYLENTPDLLNDDPSMVVIPGLNGETYAREAAYGEVYLSKVFNFDAYAFKFPLSLRREALKLRYRRVDIRDPSRIGDGSFNQYGLGITFDVVGLNILPFQFEAEYVHNDETALADSDVIEARVLVAF